MGTITSANAVVILTVPGVIPGVQLQGFAADDIYDLEQMEAVETSMGVDGILSGGFVYSAVKQTFSFQADSVSPLLFDAWYAAQRAAVEAIPCTMVVELPSIGVGYIQTTGWLKTKSPGPSAGKTLKPRKFTIEFESATPAPL